MSRYAQRAETSLDRVKNPVSVTHIGDQVLVRYLLRHCLGRGQQGAAKGRDVTGLRVPVHARLGFFRARQHIDRMFCGTTLVVEFVDGAL